MSTPFTVPVAVRFWVGVMETSEALLVAKVEAAVMLAMLVRLPLESIRVEPLVRRLVVASTLPGATKVDGILKVTAPVEAEAVIWLAVPAMEVTAVPEVRHGEPRPWI